MAYWYNKKDGMKIALFGPGELLQPENLEFASALLAPVVTSSKDFVPALLHRIDTTQKNIINQDDINPWNVFDTDAMELIEKNLPARYYGGLLKQVNIFLLPQDERYIEGFMSFRHDHLKTLPSDTKYFGDFVGGG